MSEKIKVAPGANIKIEFSRSRGENSEAKKPVPEKKKGIIRRSSSADYLPRRTRPGNVRVFDMARTADGEEIYFLISKELDISTESEFDQPTYPLVADFAERDEFLFDLVESGNFENYFYEIKRADGDFYRVTTIDNLQNQSPTILTSDSEHWTNKGFKKPATVKAMYLDSNEGGFNQEWRINLFSALYFLDESEGNLQKVTTEYDFNAEAVSDFRLGNNDIVFWMPRLSIFFVKSEYPNQTGNDYGDFSRILGDQLRFAPRQYYIENGSEPEVDITIASVIAGTPPEDYAHARAAALWHQNNLPDQRCYQGYYDYAADEWVSTEIDPPNVLPNPPFTEAPSAAVNIDVNIIGYFEENGILVAIIKRGNQKFYLWRTGF